MSRASCGQGWITGYLAENPRKRSVSASELGQELRDQTEALRASAEAFDAGKRWEAKRLATTAYIRLNDGGTKSKPLFGQLGLQGEKLSTADHGPTALMPLAIIIGEMMSRGADFSVTPFAMPDSMLVGDVPARAPLTQHAQREQQQQSDG